MNNYNVGQILFVVLKKDNKVVPIQIAEEITKKTIEGISISYTVRGGPDLKSTMLLSDIDGEVFDSHEALKATLSERATRSIGKIVDAAVQRSREWYPNPTYTSKTSTIENLRNQDDVEVHEISSNVAEEMKDNMIQMPDGTIAKIKSIKVPDSMRG